MGVREHHPDRVGAREGGPAGQEEVGHRPQRVEVASAIDRVAEDLLRRHEERRAGDHAVMRRLGRHLPAPGRRLDQAEVEQLGHVVPAAPIRGEEVGRLDVAMDQPLAVCLVESRAGLPEQVDRPAGPAVGEAARLVRVLSPRPGLSRVLLAPAGPRLRQGRGAAGAPGGSSGAPLGPIGARISIASPPAYRGPCLNIPDGHPPDRPRSFRSSAAPRRSRIGRGIDGAIGPAVIVRDAIPPSGAWQVANRLPAVEPVGSAGPLPVRDIAASSRASLQGGGRRAGHRPRADARWERSGASRRGGGPAAPWTPRRAVVVCPASRTSCLLRPRAVPIRPAEGSRVTPSSVRPGTAPRS